MSYPINIEVFADLLGIYLSGPMTGVPEFNFPAFNAAARQWRQRGYTVYNPAESFNGDTSLPRATYIRKDIENLLRAGIVAVLPGWERSQGAQLELSIARELGLMVIDVDTGLSVDLLQNSSCMGQNAASGDDPMPVEEHPLDEARRLVMGDRQNAYGHPLDDFTRTGHIMGAILERWRRGEEYAVPPELVALCQIAVKLSREVNAHKRDNVVDGIGYWMTAHMVHEERTRRLEAQHDAAEA